MSHFKAKCTKFDSGLGFAPDPAGGDYSDPQTHIWIYGALLVTVRVRGEGKREEREWEKGGVEEWGREGRGRLLGMDAPGISKMHDIELMLNRACNSPLFAKFTMH